MKLLENIDDAKHVVIEFEDTFLASASALYTHILRLHKKVSLVCISKDINNKLSFLPWFEKIRTNRYSTADLNITLTMTSYELYESLKNSNISLNKKMATALYAGILIETKCFSNNKVNGTIFAVANELIEHGAEYKICTSHIQNSNSLSFLRLKALMLKSMSLKDNATLAIMSVSDRELKETGANLKDSYEVLEEALKLVHIREVKLLKSDESDKIIKCIKKEM